LAQPPTAQASGDRPWEQPGAQVGQEVTGPAGITLVWVPGGSFMMGSEEPRWLMTLLLGRLPVHRVELSGFWIGKTEVTVAQWQSVMGRVPDESSDRGEDHPVVGVSWHDCNEFCENTGLALPTEAQWEYAAAGPDSRRYPWGDDWDGDRLCWPGNKGPGGMTFPVGSFPSGASWCGALDMAGNVWEWCADWYDKLYYDDSPLRDPLGPDSGSRRVLRGGGWRSFADLCRCAFRFYNSPAYSRVCFGFRVCSNCG